MSFFLLKFLCKSLIIRKLNYFKETLISLRTQLIICVFKK